MQESMDLFSADVCDDLGLTISTKKTVVMYQPVSYALYTKPTIWLKRQRLGMAGKFVYLASTISCSITIVEEVSYTIAKANSVFGTRI